MRVKDFHRLLVFSSVKSNKFWGILGKTGELPYLPYRRPHWNPESIVEYGRIGRLRPSRFHTYESLSRALDVMDTKLHKGYDLVSVRSHDDVCCEDSDTVMTSDCGSRLPKFHLCLGCGSRIDHSDDSANFSRFINQSLHRRSYGTKGGSDA